MCMGEILGFARRFLIVAWPVLVGHDCTQPSEILPLTRSASVHSFIVSHQESYFPFDVN